MHLTTKGSQFFSLVHLVGSDHAVCRGDEEIYRGQHPVPYPFTRPAKSLISSPSGTFLSLSQLLNLTFFPNSCSWNQAKNPKISCTLLKTKTNLNEVKSTPFPWPHHCATCPCSRLKSAISNT